MRVSRVHQTLVLLAAVISLAVGQASTGIEMCSQADCDCQLPTVRAEGRTFTKTIGAKVCVCMCGSELNEECRTDGQCVLGGYCKFEYSTADASFSSAGKCTSNCDRKDCPQFNECQIEAGGSAVCACSRYPCDNSVMVPICAAAIDDRTILRFNNTCLFVNENCDRKTKGLSELKSFVCMDS